MPNSKPLSVLLDTNIILRLAEDTNPLHIVISHTFEASAFERYAACVPGLRIIDPLKV